MTRRQLLLMPAAVALFALPPLVILAPAGAEARCPQILVVMDRSASMNGTLKGGERKWDVAKAAVKTFVADLESRVRFGFMFFPGGVLGGGDRLGASGGDFCEPGFKVMDPTLDAAAAISAAVDVLEPTGLTPTQRTLEGLASYSPLMNDAYDEYVLLITDGQPTCLGVSLDPSGASIAAIGALAGKGIKTIVVGFDLASGDINPDVLDKMAAAGGMARAVPPAATRFYSANDPAELAGALADIGGAVLAGTVGGGCFPSGPDAGSGAGSGGPVGDSGSGGAAGQGGSAGQGGPGAGARIEGDAGCSCGVRRSRPVAAFSPLLLIAAVSGRQRRSGRR